jgi:hypothetical protein
MVGIIPMHETPPEISAAAIIAAATIYVATLPRDAGKPFPSDDEAATRVAEMADTIIAKFTG